MDRDEKKSALEFLRRCDVTYEALVSHLLDLERRGDDAETLKWTTLVAGVAWVAHTGRFADGRLESILLKVAKKLDLQAGRGEAAELPVLRASSPRHVLHVSTCALEYGGHTPLIDNWIRNDGESLHSLCLLDQRYHRIPAGLASRVAASGGRLTVLKSNLPMLEKAQLLRQLAQSGFHCIILHTNPSDVVPIIALATERCPPVAIMNHADNFFWLGPSVADLIIDYREYGARLSQRRRFARRSMVLPIPLDFTPPPLCRKDARAQLSLRNDEVMLLSIGTTYKYTPTESQNFFRTMYKILARNPTTRLYVIGVTEDTLDLPPRPERERVHLFGITNDLIGYQLAADIYLEGFPYGSTTALLETTAQGVCPVLMYAPISAAVKSNEEDLKGLVTHAATEEEYVEHVTALINDSKERARLGAAVKKQVVVVHSSDHWRDRLRQIYRYLDSVEHRPEGIPATERAETEDDLGLSAFNRVRSRAALLQQVHENTLDSLTVRDILEMARVSLLIGDTRLRLSQIKGWLGLLRNRAFFVTPVQK